MMDTEILHKLNSDSNREKGTMHQQDTEDQAMAVWETLDDSMIDNVEEENQKLIEQNLRMLRMMIIIFWCRGEISCRIF